LPESSNRPNGEPDASEVADAIEMCARPGFAAAVRDYALDGLAFNDRFPAQSRASADLSAQTLGMLAIHLDATCGLHHRGLRALSGRGGLVSAGRATALLWRMQALGLIAPAGKFERGKERIYKPLPAMLEAFRARLRVDFEALARIDEPTRRVVARYNDEPDLFVRLNSLIIARLLGDIVHRNRVQMQPLGGVNYLAMGHLITSAVAAEAFAAGRERPEGPVTLSLSALARRFDVSRAHVRRVIRILETIGLQSDPADHRRFVLTPAFRDRFELFHAYTLTLLRAVVAQL
jgi:hypothetical protein